MSHAPDLDRLITAWLDDRAMPRAPDDLIDETLARTSRLRRRPAWLIPERWVPMPITMRLAVVPRGLIYVFLLALLAALLAAGGLVVGSVRNAAVMLPPPTGIARNGLIAYGVLGDIWLMDEDGGQRRQLTSGPDLDWVGGWSPDGTLLAFWSLAFDGDPSDDRAVTKVINSDGGSVKVIGPGDEESRTLASGLIWPSDCGTDLSWSPDSASLVYAHTAVEDGSVVPLIEVVSVHGGASRLLARHAMTPSWAPDGRTIAYANDLYVKDPDGSPALGRGISVVDVAGGDPRPISRVSGSGCAFNEPQWSNDSSRIVFYADGDGAHEIWMAAADGSGEAQISPGKADEYWPRWSPDNQRIAYDHVVLPISNAPQFVLTDPNGGSQVMLDHPPLSPRYPTWSPDGTLLLGMTMNDAYDDTTGLILVDVTGATPPVTIDTGSLWGDPAWQRLAP